MWLEHNGELKWEAELVANTQAAALCVAISALVENKLKTLMRFAGHQFGNRANFGHIMSGWESDFEEDCGSIEELEHYHDVRLVRLMANCFKHSDGEFSEPLVAAWPERGMTTDDEVPFASQLTEEDIDGAFRMVLDAYGKLVEYCTEQADGERPSW